MKKTVLFSIVLFLSLVMLSTFANAADNKLVNDEQELKDAISKANEGEVIELAKDITLTSPVEIAEKNITITGNGHSISKAENWKANGNNGSLITAGAGAKLELINLTLKDAQKYGVQAYNGGRVVLNGVTISNCGYGGVLANAGTVEIKDLTLQKNGTPNNNGIEIAKGDNTSESNIPTVIMNGTLSSTEKENVIYVAENNPNLKKMEVKNANDTIDKILIDNGKVVITDDSNHILYQSSINMDLDIVGEKYEDTNKKDEKKDKTPKTGIEGNLVLALVIMTLSMVTIIALKKNKIVE